MARTSNGSKKPSRNCDDEAPCMKLYAFPISTRVTAFDLN
jgi:hypothetical protein